LQEFLSKITEPPNLYALSKHGTPSKPGKKAHKRKACTKTTAKALSTLQEEIDMHISTSSLANQHSVGTDIAICFANTMQVF